MNSFHSKRFRKVLLLMLVKPKKADVEDPRQLKVCSSFVGLSMEHGSYFVAKSALAINACASS